MVSAKSRRVNHSEGWLKEPVGGDQRAQLVVRFDVRQPRVCTYPGIDGAVDEIRSTTAHVGIDGDDVGPGQPRLIQGEQQKCGLPRSVRDADSLAAQVLYRVDLGLCFDYQAPVLHAGAGNSDVDEIAALSQSGDGRRESGSDHVVSALLEQPVRVQGRQGVFRVDCRLGGKLTQVHPLDVRETTFEDSGVTQNEQRIVVWEVSDANGHEIYGFLF